MKCTIIKIDTSHFHELDAEIRILICVILDKICSVAFSKEDWLQDIPNLSVSPMFTKDVSRVDGTRDKGEDYNLGSDSFSHTMV